MQEKMGLFDLSLVIQVIKFQCFCGVDQEVVILTDISVEVDAFNAAGIEFQVDFKLELFLRKFVQFNKVLLCGVVLDAKGDHLLREVEY